MKPFPFAAFGRLLRVLPKGSGDDSTRAGRFAAAGRWHLALMRRPGTKPPVTKPRAPLPILLATGLLSAVAAVAEAAETGPADTAEQPNIVVIVADDLGWNDVGYHGSKIQTPNLDRLAEGGARLEQFYAYATCSPTRAALLSARNPARFRIHGPLASSTELSPEDMQLPLGLQRAGYSTHLSGKWHLGETPEHRPLGHGFTTTYGYLRGQIDPYTHRYKFGDHVTWHRNDHFIEQAGHVTDLIAEEAVRVIDSAAAVDQSPFFLYVAHHAPHYPMNEPPKWIEPYEDVFDDVWRRHYAAAVSHMDDSVGRVIEALERTGQRERTLVVFFSDNGGQESWSAPQNQYNGRYAAHTRLGDNTPYRGWKGSLYEGAIRVPALVNWPGRVPAGQRIERPTHVLDWAPTMLNLAGAERDGREASRGDGVDLAPLVLGEAEQQSGRRFYWRQGNQQAVRDGDWKLIVRGQQRDRAELFHLGDDPHEQHDLAGEHPERVRELLELLSSWPW